MQLELIARIVLAGFLGAFIGLERDIHGRPAGLRTNMVVSMGSALFMVLSEAIPRMAGPYNLQGFPMAGDPGRIAAQIVTGIGFLGAGVIIKSGLSIRGLTTAACLWLVAGIGMASGAGLILEAIMVTFISTLALIYFAKIERLYRKRSFRTLYVLASREADVSLIIAAVKNDQIQIKKCDITRDYVKNEITVSFRLGLYHKGITDKISHSLFNRIEQTGIELKKLHWGDVRG